MNAREFRDLHQKANAVKPIEVMYLDELYRNTDMPFEEYVGHLRIFAGGKC
jgi:hypothetical protein